MAMKYTIRKGTVGDSIYFELSLEDDSEVMLELGNSFEGHPPDSVIKIKFASIEQVQELAVKLLSINNLEDFETLWLKYD